MATRMAEDPAWSVTSAPPPSSTEMIMARPSTRAICQGPVPIQLMSRSPTPMPTLTPTTSSTTRRSRCCPMPTPMQMTTAMGAKNGRGWPNTSVATSQAMAAATEH